MHFLLFVSLTPPSEFRRTLTFVPYVEIKNFVKSFFLIDSTRKKYLTPIVISGTLEVLVSL